MKIVKIVSKPSELGRLSCQIVIENPRGAKCEIVTWALGACALNSLQSLTHWSDEEVCALIDWLPNLWGQTLHRHASNEPVPSHDMKIFLFTNAEYFMTRWPKFCSHPKVKKAFSVANHAHGGHRVDTYLIDVS